MLTAETIFKGLRIFERRISIAEEKVSLFSAIAQRITISMSDDHVGGSSNSESFEDAVIRLSEAKEHLNKLLADYYETINILSKIMSQISRSEYEQFLTQRYINNLSINAICRKMHRSRTSLHRLRISALEELNRLISTTDSRRFENIFKSWNIVEHIGT